MAKILVFTDHTHGDFKRGTYELLTAAKGAGDVSALVVGAGADQAATKLSGWGVAEALVCTDPNLSSYNPELFAGFVAGIISSGGYSVVLASSTMLARDLFPRVAAKLDAGVASDCTELRFENGEPVARKPLYSGKCSARVEFQNCSTKIILMRPNQLPVGSAGNGAAPVRNVTLTPADIKTKVRDVVRGASEKLDLMEANVIVAGGRGMQGPEQFKMLEDLAATIGATVGASRAVVDAGWVPHSMQVGQTGKTVAPSLYIACGISGAIQHLAGMSASKVIVAINKDADAPIFQKATYGIVGDVFEVLPKLTAEFKAMN